MPDAQSTNPHHALSNQRQAEMTVRGLLLGAAITIVFMGAPLYMGLKTGMTFSSSIPAAVISMAMLRLLGQASILENNIVQTQASAAGTLCNVILVLPGLVIIGQWHGFPFWQTMLVCLLGGLLGVMFSVPLRRTMVAGSDLPFPEGVAAAEVLRAGHGGNGAEGGIRLLLTGGAAAGAFNLCSSGLRVLGDGLSSFATVGGAVFEAGTGFSLALVGVGYLVGIAACSSLLIGAVLAWGVAVPILTALHPVAGLAPDKAALAVWTAQVRLIGAGIIAVGAVWTVATLARPIMASIVHGLETVREARNGREQPRQERDIPITWVAAASAALALPIGGLFAWFAAPQMAQLGLPLYLALVVGTALFTVLFGFLMAAACGYMAGLLGSSSSPISGIGILTTMLAALVLGLVLRHAQAGAGPDGQRFAIGLGLFVTAAIVTVASIANDNLQDLKTGQMVDATPWLQQVALLVGVCVGALVVAPLLALLYHAYGFVGAMPRPGMDGNSAMAAPQASLMSGIAKGIFDRTLPWTMVLTGIALGSALIGLDEWLRRRGRQLPVLTVGIGMYLPLSVVITIAIGGVLGWLGTGALRRARADEEATAQVRRRGVLVAAGFLVGESFVGILIAAVDAATGHGGSLTVTGAGFAPVATGLGLAAFGTAAVLFYRLVSRPA